MRVKLPIRAGEFARIANLPPYKVIADLIGSMGLPTVETELTVEALETLGQKNNLRIEIVSPGSD